jgi:hypothetical protein
MRYLFLLGSLLVMLGFTYELSKEQSFSFDHSDISFHGRFDFSNKSAPKVWAPGAYVQFSFSGTDCAITLLDEMKYGNHHNYIHVVVDGVARRIKLSGKHNRISIATNLNDTIHEVTICKDTESAIGFIQFHEIICDKLLPKIDKDLPIIEFIGDSITCGNGSDLSMSDCSTADWYDQHNAYDAYGPIVARALGMNYLLSSVSGIGLMRSCCGKKYTLPEVYHSIDLKPRGRKWDVKMQQPDIICITLGQNDGLQNELLFIQQYIAFIQRLKAANPSAKFICCSSPMATETLSNFHAIVLPKITSYFKDNNDTSVHHFLYNGHFRGGCDAHPTVAEHKLIAEQLVSFIAQLL